MTAEEEKSIQEFKESVIYKTIIDSSKEDNVFLKWLEAQLNPQINIEHEEQEISQEEAANNADVLNGKNDS